jgi:hypothetical protein
LYVEHGRDVSGLAAQALRRIQALYAIEANIRGQPPEIRRDRRRARAGPLLAELHEWLHAVLARVSTKSELAKAARYSLGRWQALTRYVDHARIEIDNSAAERALRGVALGRNNYLFMGSDEGGERAGSLYSLMGTTELNGLHPEGYLRHVLCRIGEHRINRFNELLPWNIAGPATARSRMTHGAEPRLLDALSRASSLELFQLQTIIERMLADPKRIIAVRVNMHLVQPVRFLDWRDGQMRSGKVADMRDTQVVLHELPPSALQMKGPLSEQEREQEHHFA